MTFVTAEVIPTTDHLNQESVEAEKHNANSPENSAAASFGLMN